MTQLFDTDTYEYTGDPVTDIDSDNNRTGNGNGAGNTTHAGASRSPRHLRSVRATTSTPPIAWRLDDQTIETGRRGIQAARQALQAAAKDNKTPARKAA